ncbi:hypothetical protein C5Y96_11360 [Blastopirellula marina]|uniref:Uncharacterized protein n=1 Tax=Blastopirellula marina TaxID=124 RepID=A0A2S8FNL3_9BACT|nr:hypothetical protein C5Y96_11360 [Blastopirellula marina]RCS52524.1 hypothetical protein DTL36_11370 [Bremerella cremea]
MLARGVTERKLRRDGEIEERFGMKFIARGGSAKRKKHNDFSSPFDPLSKPQTNDCNARIKGRADRNQHPWLNQQI